VDEAVIVEEHRDNGLPPGVITHPKIKVVTKGLKDIGYGRKMNFGIRNASGNLILQLNDDVFLNPDAVSKMKECMTHGAGTVGNILRYPNGLIYHAGKRRDPGGRGWGHISHNQQNPELTEITELENICGCCLLVRREAHFSIDGFDEDYFLFGEDDDYSLRMRRAGWKNVFTPFSQGIHLENQTVSRSGNKLELIKQGQSIFESKWGSWLTKNANTIPGNFQ
jgi:GT2 family glycosyltransferase